MGKYDLLEAVVHPKQYDFVKGEGAVLIDSRGERYLDLDEMCIFLGQGNRHFTETLTEALQGITNGRCSTVNYKERLTQQLMDTTDHLFEAVHFTSSGSEAVEWAVRLAKKLTGRSEIISFWNSIHGRTYLSASMSGLPKRKVGYAPLAPGLVYGVYPDCQHCPLDKQPESCHFFCLDFLEKKVRYESAQDIAAIIIEPYQGAGIIVPPEGYFQRLQAWAREKGILLIMDEIQAGLGRTGSLYCYQQLGIEPDMLLLGKGLGNGLHISALLTRKIPESSCLGAVSGGTGDDTLACAAACAVLDEVRNPDYLARIRAAARRLRGGLEEIAQQCGGISHIRVQGLAAAIEFDSPETGREVNRKMAEKHFLFGRMGDQMMVLKPPLCLTEEQVLEFLEGLKDSLQQ